MAGAISPWRRYLTASISRRHYRSKRTLRRPGRWSLECQNPTNASQQKSHRASWAAVRHRKHDLPPHLGELTIRVAINRNAEALHDASNLAK